MEIQVKYVSSETTLNEGTKTLHQNTLELLPLAQPVSIDPAANSSQLLADNYHFATREEMESLSRQA